MGIEVTEIKVFPINEDRLRAYVTITLNHCFVVRDMKIIHGPNGLFVAMPSKRHKNGQFMDIAHPLNQKTRKVMEDAIFQAYEETLKELESSLDEVSKKIHP